jgi:hypothetical protein
MHLDAMTLAQACSSQQFLGITVVFAILASILFPRLFQKQKGDDSDDGLFTANKRYSWEPSYFSRVRWITNAQEIITEADEKVGSSPDAPFHVV